MREWERIFYQRIDSRAAFEDIVIHHLILSLFTLHSILGTTWKPSLVALVFPVVTLLIIDGPHCTSDFVTFSKAFPFWSKSAPPLNARNWNFLAEMCPLLWELKVVDLIWRRVKITGSDDCSLQNGGFFNWAETFSPFISQIYTLVSLFFCLKFYT